MLYGPGKSDKKPQPPRRPVRRRPVAAGTALTRAASRLILFGDPGTLARRCQWNGAVEHLDEASGERERGRIAQLVAYLHGDGPHPTTFGLEESGRV